MAEEQRYLYHCDRCGELFKSNRRAQEDIICGSCGEHPVRPKFAAVAQMPALDKHDKKSKHGVPGMDEADIFSMKKKRQRKNWTIICLIWVVGLAMITLMGISMNDKAKLAGKSDVELDDADKAYLIRKDEAFQKCAQRFLRFASETVIHSKSSHILNGSDLVLDINRYYSSHLMKNDLATSRILRFDLVESDENSKLVALLRYIPSSTQTSETYDFEIIFWKVGDDWLIDWPNFVRLGDMNWFKFGEAKRKNSPKRFKLYARELSTESLGLSGYEEYKFSEAYNSSTLPSQLSKSVFVKHQTDLKTQLTNKFKELREQREKKIENHDILGSFDPPRTIRLDVTVDFEEIEGETVMVLREIHKLDWQNPPSEKD
ncbi:MAG: hypothetical protein ACSHX6_06540 [Akkermansiaceae bacterium]